MIPADPSPDFLSAMQVFRRSGDASALVASIPYAAMMGLSVGVDDEGVVTTMHYAEHLIGNPYIPALHGGTLGGLLEFAAAFEVFHSSETLVFPKIINLTIGYLRSGKPQDTVCRCSITKQGRRVVTVDARAWQMDRARPIATATAQFLIKSPEAFEGSERLPLIPE